LKRIALLAAAPDSHVRALARAIAALGAQPVIARIAACAFDTRAPSGLRIPGCEALPDAVLVREIDGGSFEEVTRRLGILHALRELGVPVWNDARAIERCVDKSMTSFLLARAGIATPDAWTVEGLAAAQEVVAREAGRGRLVLKPLFGSQGRGLRLIEDVAALPPAEQVQGVYYLQRYVSPVDATFHDHRLLICGDALVAAMTRRAAGWITNIARGATAERFTPDAAMVELAVRAAAATGAAYAGVDLLRAASDETLVLEVNSMPAWRGLQRVTEGSIARRLAALLLERL
jgi:RimK family alpha-L-glutamate ligase